ncbi:EAL domain-containing protein [Endothiovibrio diazotrophicus]
MDTPLPLLLILHPDPATGHTVERLLREGTTPVETLLACDEAALQAILTGTPPALVIGTDRVVGGDPTLLLGLIAGPGKDVPFIALIEHEEDAEHLLALGARDVVSLEQPLRLRLAVQRELDTLAQRRTLRTLREALRNSEVTLRELLEQHPAPTACVTAEGHLYANPAYVDRFGFHSPESLRDTPPAELFPEGERAAIRQVLEEAPSEWHINLRDGGHTTLLVLRRMVLGGQPCALLTLRSEPSPRRLDEKLDYVGNRDRLTGLHNRGFFLEELALGLGRVDRSLLYLEVAGFERVRVEQGHAAANLLLQELSALLQHPLAEEETAGRYGGPRFGVILHRPADEAETLAEQLSTKLAARLGNAGCPIGLCNLSGESDADAALEHARLAARLAGEAADGRCHRYRPEIDGELHRDQHAAWRRRLEAALSDDEGGFRLVYQPIVYLHATPVDLFEVLLRMVDDEGETLLPGQFLPIAEREGLSGRVDRWVIDEALRQLAGHYREGRSVRFFVKLAAATVLDDELARWLEGRLGHHQLPGEALVLELTEAVIDGHRGEVERQLRGLKRLRCGLAVERFGRIEEADALIGRLPLDYFKFDGALTHRLADNPAHRERVEALSLQVQQAGKRTIVQFVEDADTLNLLWEIGIHYIQGYLLQAPETTLDYDFDEPPPL